MTFNKKRQSCAYCRALLSIATFRHILLYCWQWKRKPDQGVPSRNGEKTLGETRLSRGGHFSSGQTNQEFNSRLHKSQIVQRTHLIPVVFCRWRGLHWGCLCDTSSWPGLHWHGACCNVRNNIPCSVLRCIHQISANVWELHAYRKLIYYSQYTHCILK